MYLWICIYTKNIITLTKKKYVIVPKSEEVDNLITISSMAAFEGAHTKIFWTPDFSSIEIIPFIV